MQRGHIQHLGRSVARVGAGVLVVASIGFAAPALAAQPDSPGNSAAGRAHQSAHQSTDDAKHASGHHQAVTTSHSASQGGSGVSLPRPNDFQAQADPDGMANGGVDQPGGTGGVDTTTQDGNNGSGNDTDCEDDNNGVGVPGHCKDAPAPAPVDDTSTVADQPANSATADQTTQQATTQEVSAPVMRPMTDSTQVLVPSLFAPGTGAPAAKAAARSTAATGVLPSTGAGGALAGVSLAGLAALGLGAALARQGRRARVRG